MPNREVNLTKRVQTQQGMRYCRVVLPANGRVKPDVVVVNGKEERHLEGAYYLEWREGSKRVRLSVGKDAQDAAARRLRKEAELNAVNNGVAVVPESDENGHRSLAAAVAEFLEETKLTKKPKTLAAYSTSLAYFQESCSKLYLEDIGRRDLLKFSAFLRDDKAQAPRSCWNKFANVMSFLRRTAFMGWCAVVRIRLAHILAGYSVEQHEVGVAATFHHAAAQLRFAVLTLQVNNRDRNPRVTGRFTGLHRRLLRADDQTVALAADPYWRAVRRTHPA